LARTGHTTTLLSDGTVLVVGGSGTFGTDSSTTAEIYHPSGYVDLTPPVITVPDGRTVPADSVEGATVYYEVSVSDDADSFVTVSCTPESGTLFPIGTTTVACESTDSAGNHAVATFSVTVRPPLEIAVTLSRRQWVDPRTGVARLAGHAACNRDVEVRLFGTLSQRGASNTFYVSVACVAPRTSWTATAYISDPGLEAGAADVDTSATACDVGCDSEQRRHRVRLRESRPR
jgi:hypothetical protein